MRRTYLQPARFSGRLRQTDYRQLLEHFREGRKDRETVARESARKGSRLAELLERTGGPDWWRWYEHPFVEHAAAACVLFGWGEKFKSFADADNPPLEFMNFTNSAESDIDPLDEWPDEKRAACFSLVISMGYSLEAVGFYSRTINELLHLAREGDRESLVDAMTIDRCVVMTPTGSQIVAQAQLAGDRRFLNRIFKRMKEPKKKLLTYVDLRLLTRLLVDAGDFASRPSRELEALVQSVNITAPPGAKELRDQMRRFKV